MAQGLTSKWRFPVRGFSASSCGNGTFDYTNTVSQDALAITGTWGLGCEAAKKPTTVGEEVNRSEVEVHSGPPTIRTTWTRTAKVWRPKWLAVAELRRLLQSKRGPPAPSHAPDRMWSRSAWT